MSDALDADVLGFDYAGSGVSRIGRGGRRDHRGGGGGGGGGGGHHPPTPLILDPPTGGQCRADC